MAKKKNGIVLKDWTDVFIALIGKIKWNKWNTKIVSLAINPKNISVFFSLFANEFPFFQIPTNPRHLGDKTQDNFAHFKRQIGRGHFSFGNQSLSNKKEMNRKESPNYQWSMEYIRFKKWKSKCFIQVQAIVASTGIIKPWYHPQFAIIGCHFISIINQFSNWPRNWCGEIVDIYGKISSHWMDQLNAIHYSRISISIGSHKTQSDMN